MRECVCRNCGNIYEEDRSQAAWKGYCTARCMHAKAKLLGYRTGTENYHNSEYTVLKNANAIGSVFFFTSEEQARASLTTDDLKYGKRPIRIGEKKFLASPGPTLETL